MSWLPRVGEPLPRAREATGIRQKLLDYSLEIRHETGGPKALGFERILGITRDHIDYVEQSIRIGILSAPIHSIRQNPPFGINCVVEFPIQGVGDKRMRTVNLRTTWIFVEANACPRMLTAFLRP